jgi:dehydrogenase/reductase SDR family protein 1
MSSVYAAPMMVRQRSGLIVNISSGGGGQYLFSVAYGVGKCAVDRMAKDMAVELHPYDVAAVSLWPAAVRTEFIMSVVARGAISLDPRQMESPRFTGRCVAALALDPKLMEKSGGVYRVADLRKEYHFQDIEYAG